ncbi:MAG: alpha/beta hydrolase [Clostridia bacterium]|nr:alpha/beta hydrolase [Clostridia bacterium]
MEKEERKGRKIRRIIGRILLSLLALIVLAACGLFVYDKVNDRAIVKQLDELGYVNTVSVGSHDLNVYLTGDPDSPYTLVYIAGLGSMAGLADTEPLTDRLADRYRFAIVDRSGYGLSEDTKEPQTVEQIVSDYRAALKAAGVEGPYVLMPHSIGGVYASYWEATYPEEIKAIVFLDVTQIGDPDYLEDAGFQDSVLFLKVEAALCKIGIDRLVFDPASQTDFYTAEDKKALGGMLWRICPISWARCSEEKYIYSNIRTAFNSLSPNDIPKLMIYTSAETEEDARELFSYYKALTEASGGDASYYDKTDEEIAAYVKERKEFDEMNLQPYIDRLGNVTYLKILGHHYIYSHKPDEVAKAIDEFLTALS